MKLNHLTLTVTDVTATRSFLQTYFQVPGGFVIEVLC
jgi:hypothetical protein